MRKIRSDEALGSVILELRMTLGKMESMLDIVTDPIVCTDKEGIIRWCNEPFAHLAGKPRLVLLGARFEQEAPLRRHGLPASEPCHPAANKTKEAKNILYELACSDGDRLFDVSWATLKFPQSEPFVIFALHDVTEVRRSADVLARNKVAIAEAEAANKAKDNFLALVSHELRTPATSILGWAQLLSRRDARPEESAKALASIERNLNSLTQIIDDLVDVSSISVGKLSLKTSRIDFGRVVRSALAMLSVEARGKEVAIDESGVQEGIGVDGDPGRLEQVVWNLLSNALKFSPAQGKVRVRLDRHGRFARLSVADEGCGINAELIPFVFNRFWQSEHPMTRSHGGLGLGLSIVQHLVRLHGGMVEAASSGPGRGATFTVLIPEAGAPGPLTPAKASADVGASDVLREIRVLLVDDDADTREVLIAMLESFGAVAKAVGSAREALEILGSFQPNVLVCDLAMPNENGYELIAKVRLLDPSSGGAVPALALSAYTRDFDRRRALESGFQTYLRKPVDGQQLASAIRKAVLTISP